MSTLLQDLRFGLRMLAKNPGFTAVAVITLALGIGANTAIFSLINTLMLRLLPVQEPGQLVELLHKYPGEPRMNGFSAQSYEQFRDHNHVFSGLIGFAPTHFSVRREGADPESVNGEYVVGNYFLVLGIKPTLGRLIGPQDDQPGSASSAVAVVSWNYWKSRFNLERTVLGKQITVADVPVTVIGVTPPEFRGLAMSSKPDVWLPTALRPPSVARPGQPPFNMPLNLVGRLIPGTSIRQARADMNVLFQFTIDEVTRKSKDPQWRQLKLEIVPAGAGLAFLRDHLSQPLYVLMSLVGLLLLIACTSIATLLLARGAEREHEMALRVAIGAGRLRLLRQVLTESLLLSTAGSLLGFMIAYFAAHVLVRIMLSGRPLPGLPPDFTFDVQPDAHVLLFTAGVALITGVLFGVVPAVRALSTTPASLLQGAVQIVSPSLSKK